MFGGKALNYKIALSFTEICLISILTNIVVLPVSLFINFKISVPVNQDLRCGLPGVGLILLSILLFSLFVITIIVQHFAIRSEK